MVYCPGKYESCARFSPWQAGNWGKEATERMVENWRDKEVVVVGQLRQIFLKDGGSVVAIVCEEGGICLPNDPGERRQAEAVLSNALASS